MRKIQGPGKILDTKVVRTMTQMMEETIKSGTGRQARISRPAAGKTGTSQSLRDAWFVGFTSNILVGVYVGSDNPTSLGRFETGSKTALPIFKNFIKKTVKKSEARPFKAAKGTVMMVVDPSTGQKAKFTSKNTIIEVYKEKNIVDGKVLYLNNNRLDKNNILKFY